MARKSRKNLMPQAAVQEAVQQNEKELLRTAAYARLSVENGGHPVQIGFCVRDFGTDFKNVCTDGIC